MKKDLPYWSVIFFGENTIIEGDKHDNNNLLN
jgi:hypothetical protein